MIFNETPYDLLFKVRVSIDLEFQRIKNMSDKFNIALEFKSLSQKSLTQNDEDFIQTLLNKNISNILNRTIQFNNPELYSEFCQFLNIEPLTKEETDYEKYADGISFFIDMLSDKKILKTLQSNFPHNLVFQEFIKNLSEFKSKNLLNNSSERHRTFFLINSIENHLFRNPNDKSALGSLAISIYNQVLGYVKQDIINKYVAYFGQYQEDMVHSNKRFNDNYNEDNAQLILSVYKILKPFKVLKNIHPEHKTYFKNLISLLDLSRPYDLESSLEGFKKYPDILLKIISIKEPSLIDKVCSFAGIDSSKYITPDFSIEGEQEFLISQLSVNSFNLSDTTAQTQEFFSNLLVMDLTDQEQALVSHIFLESIPLKQKEELVSITTNYLLKSKHSLKNLLSFDKRFNTNIAVKSFSFNKKPVPQDAAILNAFKLTENNELVPAIIKNTSYSLENSFDKIQELLIHNDKFPELSSNKNIFIDKDNNVFLFDYETNTFFPEEKFHRNEQIIEKINNKSLNIDDLNEIYFKNHFSLRNNQSIFDCNFAILENKIVLIYDMSLTDEGNKFDYVELNFEEINKSNNFLVLKSKTITSKKEVTQFSLLDATDKQLLLHSILFAKTQMVEHQLKNNNQANNKPVSRRIIS